MERDATPSHHADLFQSENRGVKTVSDYRRAVAIILCATLILQLASCGTLIYPERKGQSKGRVDPTVAILDSVGILLFIIPGLIAFAVDFHTGAIYLPPGHRASDALSNVDADTLRLAPGERNAKGLERRMSSALGSDVRLGAEGVQAFRFDTAESAVEELARMSSGRALGFRTAYATP